MIATGGDSTRPAGAAERTLEHYLCLEDDPAFVEATCPSTGILAWPAIRQDVLRTLLGDRFYPTASLVGVGPRQSAIRGISAAIGSVLWNVTHRASPSDVLILGSGVGLVRVDGRLKNRLVDDFAEMLGLRAWTIEATFPGLAPLIARGNQRTRSMFVDRARIALWSRTKPARLQRRVVGDLLDLARARGRDLLGWEMGQERHARLLDVGASRLAAYPMKAGLYGRLFRQINPRLAIVEEGSYGHMAVFNAVSREHGVTVAEFQHGMVTRGHDAYNVATHLRDSEAYARTQPHAFLGYGDWWLKQFSAPIPHRLAIGNPYRSEVLQAWSPNSERPTVLILGDGVETDAHIAFAERVTGLAPRETHVVFRPHPLEAQRVTGSNPRVELDRETNLYRSLAGARAVVAEASTALFEAVGLVDRVFAWDTPKSRFYLGSHPFEPIVDAADLVARLAAPQPSRGPLMTSVWADNWQRKFQEYIQSALEPGTP